MLPNGSKRSIVVVCDNTFTFFRMPELLVHDVEPLLMSKPEMHAKIANNEDIQQQWALLSVDIDKEEYAQELLDEICDIWLSTRCHALTRKWMETYK